MGQSVLSDTEFIEKYRRLCGHIAWDFVRRSHRDVSPITLTQEDAEDFASCALIKLMAYHRSPNWSKHGDNKWYVQRIIENAITTAWRKRLKQMGTEREGTERNLKLSKLGDHPTSFNDGQNFGASLVTANYADVFDRLPGPDGMAGKTQTKFDFATVVALIPSLPNAERVVVELAFGLNGAESFSRKRIAKKLGRTEWWVETKQQAAIQRIREQIQPSV